MTDRIEVLLVEDDPDQARVIRRTLQRQEPPYGVTVASDGPTCLEALGERPFSVVLLDYSLPRATGLTVLSEMRDRGISVPVVMVTGQGDERVAVEAVKAGALDYVVKTTDYLATLPTVISKVLKQDELARENRRLYEESQRALTELRAAQEQLIRGATLRALGELASGAAHHLNNLLAVVLGRVELLLDDAGTTAFRRQLGIIRQAAVDAAEVVRRVQQFARMQATEQRPVDLNQIATDVIELTRPRWQDAAYAEGIAIAMTLEAGTIPRVHGNAGALREVITNLVINSVDAMPAGGHITIRTWSDGTWVHLAVTDTGAGMSEEVRQRAVEPFFTTKGRWSTGLGLSVNYGTVKQHGGHLEIESAEGRGTTVTISLPSCEAPRTPVPRPPAPAQPAQAASRRILVVDDDTRVRDVLAELLESRRHTVLKVPGGAEALAELGRIEPVDLVVTDLGMPGMNGWELARAIRARWPEIPIVLLTGWGSQIQATPEESQAVDLIIAKPVTGPKLDELLALCGRERPPTSS